MMQQRSGSKVAAFVRALLLLAIVVVAVPWGLMAAAEARFGGRAPLHGVPSPADWSAATIRSALTDRLTDQTIADIVIRVSLVVAWTAVLVLVVTVVAEVVHMVRHDGLPLPDIRGIGMSQSVARVIATGLLVIVPMFATPSRAVARDGTQLVPQPKAAPAAVVDGVERGAGTARPDNVWPGRSDDDPATATPTGTSTGGRSSPDWVAPTADELGSAPARAAPGQYQVRAGDSIFAIAERLAGPEPGAVAEYAERLVDLNMGRTMADGQRFNNAAYIDVGWVLDLPGASETSVGEAADADDVHTVEQGESLWSIADDALGEPERWPEIYEANRGRTFDDGRTLDDPDLIHPGWELTLPDGDASDDGPSTDGDSGTDPSEVAVSEVAESEVVADADVGDEPGPATLAPPASSSPADSDAAPIASPARPTNVWQARADRTDVAAADVAAADASRSYADGVDRGGAGVSGDESASTQLLTLGTAAMLSGGVLTLLAVRRRNRLRRARPRSVLPEPDHRPAATERALRAIDTGGRFARVDTAIRAVAVPVIEREERVEAALVAIDGDLELYVSGPVSLPTPWEGDGVRWRLPASVPLELLAADARRVGAPTPTLVQLGRTPDDRDVYVDLEALEAIEVGGPGDQADAIVAAIAATLAGSVLAEVTTLVGLGVPDAAFLDHRLHVPVRDPQRAFEAASDAIGSTAAQSRSTFELRAQASSGETWEPAVVLAGSAVGTLTPPRSRTGLAIVSASPIHGPSSRLAPDGDVWELLPAGIRLVPIGLGRDDIDAIAELVRVPDPRPSAGSIPAGDSADPGPVDADLTLAPTDRDDAADPMLERVDDHAAAVDAVPADAGNLATPPPPWSLLVRLIGPVSVIDREGASVEFERSKTRELVAWLATHRDRATRVAARTALWELDVRNATFANVVSEARRALARLVEPPEGEEWVGRTMTEALPLHEYVRTDADLIEYALEAARLQPPTQAIATLTPAVELIAGPPFEATSYLWPDAEGLTSNIVLLATSAATELAAHCLSLGDIDGVFGATGRGLRVLPGHEELIGLRMQAHARSGDHAGVRHEWESYERVITADPWSDGEPSPKLVGLRRELLNPSR